MDFTSVAFWALAGLAVAGGVGLSLTRNVVHGALFLLVSLMAMAGVFLLLFAEFLALVQVLIYGGAITILLLFALMLTNAPEQIHIRDTSQKPLAMLAALAVFALFAFTAYNTPWKTAEATYSPTAFVDLGATIFRYWVVPFELASAILLVALVGAVVIAWPKEEGQ